MDVDSQEVLTEVEEEGSEGVRLLILNSLSKKKKKVKSWMRMERG